MFYECEQQSNILVFMLIKSFFVYLPRVVVTQSE